ncbi:MAG: S8 family serine peptidase [Trueperaceae bacterium]
MKCVQRFGIFLVNLLFLVACGGGTASFSLTGNSVSVLQGSFGRAVISASFEAGSDEIVTLSLESSTAGITGTFEPLTIRAATPQSSLNVNVAGSVSPGAYEVTVKGTSGSGVATTTIIVTVSVTNGGGDDGDPGAGSISGIVIAPGTLNIEDFNTAGLDAVPIKATVHDTFKGGKAEVIPGEVIVHFVSSVGEPSKSGQGITTQALKMLEVGNSRLQRVREGALKGSGIYRTEGLDEAATLRLVRELEARPDVVDAHPNWKLHTFKAPNDSAYGAQWHYPAMNLPAAWDIEDGAGSGVVVAVVDSGIIPHPDISAAILPGYDFISDATNGGDGDGRDDDPTDFSEGGIFHGSHVAGTIAATTNNAQGVAGVNWGAKILPVRVMDVNGTGSLDDILSGVAWAAGLEIEGVPVNPTPARVINLSLGGDIGEPCPESENTFFAELAATGVMVVAAAGNENTNVATSFPANCDGVITVGATNIINERAPYSNFGTGIDVMAPGGDTSQSFTVGDRAYPAGVLSIGTDSAGDYGYVFFQGTSMASPHIAGLVSLLLFQDNTLTFDALLSKLKAASTPLADEACGRSSAECGAGLVDAAKALGGEGGGTPPPPTPGEDISMYVIAAYCLDTECNESDTDLSKVLEITELQARTPYQLLDLVPGDYYAVGAYQDLNGNAQVDEDEFVAIYPSLVAVGAGQDVLNINLRLQPYSPASATPDRSQLARAFSFVLDAE